MGVVNLSDRWRLRLEKEGIYLETSQRKDPDVKATSGSKFGLACEAHVPRWMAAATPEPLRE